MAVRDKEKARSLTINLEKLLCIVETSKAKFSLFSVMWTNGTVPKQCWKRSVGEKIIKLTISSDYLPEEGH